MKLAAAQLLIGMLLILFAVVFMTTYGCVNGHCGPGPQRHRPLGRRGERRLGIRPDGLGVQSPQKVSLGTI